MAFYRWRNFKPAWTGGFAEERMARDAREALVHAHEQGLNDADYALPETARPALGVDAAEYDLAITESVLRYASDVRTGRVKPKQIYDDVGLPPRLFDAAMALDDALRARSLRRFFADLPPPHPEYRALAEAYVRYREIADEGGWPSIPDKSEIKLDGKNSRVAVLAERLKFEDPILANILKPSAPELREAIKRFQARHGLDADGHTGSATLVALNVPASARAEQIAANMERWRWLPRTFERRYIAVNVPDQSLDYVRNDTVVLSSKVVVGRKSSPTPITRSAITAVVANPPWNIPGYIAARDLLPHLRENPNYLAAKHMVVMNGPAGDPTGRSIDWRHIAPAEFPYAIRQLPGPAAALGQVMLDSPNDFDVYLHDTPSKNLFDLTDREVSNGCVRVQQIFPLASLALADDPEDGMGMINEAIKTHETKRLTLAEPLPVYFLYWTAVVGPDGEAGFLPDRNNRDAPLIAALAQGDDATAPEVSRRLAGSQDADDPT